MGLKDGFNKLLTYFDTDDVSDVEGVDDVTVAPEAEVATPRRRRESTEVKSVAEYQQARSFEKPVQKIAQQREEMVRRVSSDEPTRIAIKFPKQYEDAREIVDLLIENESVLIDFQYMQETSARRCLDYLSGACSVLYGTLQKVSSSMYLLTPANVVVDLDDLRRSDASHRSDDNSFDFDMKRR